MVKLVSENESARGCGEHVLDKLVGYRCTYAGLLGERKRFSENLERAKDHRVSNELEGCRCQPVDEG